MKARLAVATTLAVLTALILTATASASEPLEDGAYSVTLPDGTAIAFSISDDGNTVEVGSLPTGFSVSEDDSSHRDTTEITDGTVAVKIVTGDDGGIEVDGVSFEDSSTVSALLPDAAGAVGITIDGDDIDVTTPSGFEVIDSDSEEDEVEVRISDGERTFEIEVDREDGSIEIKLQDDDSDDDGSEDAESADDSMLDDSGSEDDDSDDDDSDDDSSDDATDSSVASTTDSSIASTDATLDDDDSEDDEPEDDEPEEDEPEDDEPEDDDSEDDYTEDDDSEDDDSEDDDSSD